MLDTRFKKMLDILHAGGTHGYWWYRNAATNGKVSRWWNVGEPLPINEGTQDVYYGIHPVAEIPPTNRNGEPVAPEAARSQISYISAINCLFGEYDAKDYGTKEDALRHISAVTPRTSVLVDSGGGYHAYWLLDATKELHSADDRAFMADVQARWVRFVGSDKASKDLARVLRVPGTHNHKYNPAPEVAFIWCELDTQYNLDELIAMLPAEEPKHLPAREVKPVAASTDRLGAFLERALKDEVAEVVACADGLKHDTLRNAAIKIGTLIPHGLDHDRAFNMLHNAILGRAQDMRNADDTIEDGLRYGTQSPRDISHLSEREPIFRDGVACCPNHGTALVRSSNGNGWRCDKDAKCFWWKGEGYMPMKAASYSESETIETVMQNIPISIITASELKAKQFEPLKWAIPDILPEGCTLLAGKPKARKSWLALNFGLAVALGGRAIGWKKANRGTVLYLDLESNQRRAQRRLDSTLRDMAWPDNFHIATEWPKLDAQGDTYLDAWMQQHPDTVLVVIDVFQDIRAAANPKAQLYTDDRAAVEPLRKFASKYHVAVLIIHHTRKAKGDDVFDEISGSTGLTGGVDNIMVLSRDGEDSDKATLAIRGRDIEFDSALNLEWDIDFCMWRFKEEAGVKGSTKERNDILNIMSDGEIYTPKSIAQELGKEAKTISKLLKALESEGIVVSTGWGKYKIVIESRNDGRNGRNGGNGRNGRNGRNGIEVPFLPESGLRNPTVEIAAALESLETPISTISTASTDISFPPRETELKAASIDYGYLGGCYARGDMRAIEIHCVMRKLNTAEIVARLQEMMAVPDEEDGF